MQPPKSRLDTLRDSGLAHDHLLFYRLAIEAALSAREFDLADDLADRLAAFIEVEPPGWSTFVVERARLLAAYGRGSRDEATLDAIASLHAKAMKAGFKVAAVALLIPERPQS